VTETLPMVGTSDVQRFRAAIARSLGLSFGDDKLAFLAEVLARRLQATARASELYLQAMELETLHAAELDPLAGELTVNETYFFRHHEQFRALVEAVLPAHLAAATPKHLRILSLGCASGEEPFTLAILLREHPLPIGCHATIHGVDLCARSLARAASGRYSSWALRDTPDHIRRRWFQRDGNAFTLDPGIRQAVTFEQGNLAREDLELWRPESYDIVFCRNVIMYFTPRVAEALVARIERTLVPGGYLFLGHAETLRGLSLGYHLRHTQGTFYYQRKGKLAPEPLAPPEPTTALPDTAWWTARAATPGDDLARAAASAQRAMRAAERTSERIRDLSGAAAPRAAQLPQPSRGSLSPALELLQQERFSEALAELPRTGAADPDALLLRAVLLAQAGELGTAERVSAELLELDELDAGAHYVLALCREGVGDKAGARHHHLLAAHLDPSFAMPRLHLGIMARRAGDAHAAERELSQALTLLAREDAARVLMFGGGFGREALLSLCRAELRRIAGDR
jgi:chemotaxis protein methyltransferase CheR